MCFHLKCTKARWSIKDVLHRYSCIAFMFNDGQIRCVDLGTLGAYIRKMDESPIRPPLGVSKSGLYSKVVFIPRRLDC